MTLREVRKEKKLSQLEAADYVGISLRSYVTYENDPSKVDTKKYKDYLEKLNLYGYVDETYGVMKIEDIKSIVNKLAKDHEIKYCYLFGAYAIGKAEPTSSIDLLVQDMQGIKLYGLGESLQVKLPKKVNVFTLAQVSNKRDALDHILSKGIRIL